jgi:hypothetical protein
MAFNHGVSVAFYFEDPEEHLIEVYWPTGLAWPQPYGDPIDLTLSEEALERKVRDLADTCTSVRSRRSSTASGVNLSSGCQELSPLPQFPGGPMWRNGPDEMWITCSDTGGPIWSRSSPWPGTTASKSSVHRRGRPGN